MIEKLQITFAAGETREIAVQGQYFEVLESIYPVDVLLLKREGQVIGGIKQAEASFFTRTAGFETLQIKSDTAQTVKFMVGDGEAGTRRVAGVVKVVDAGREIVKTGLSFNAYANKEGTDADYALDKHPVVALKNISSNKNIILESVVFSARRTTQPAATSGISSVLITIPDATISSYTTSNPPQSKNIGDVRTSEAEIRIGTASFTLLDKTLIDWRIEIGTDQVSASNRIIFGKPFIIPPGKNIAVMGGEACNAVHATFDYYEEFI